MEGDETVSGQKVTEGMRAVQDRTSEAYKLQRRRWERQLKGHTAPRKKGKERESRNDSGNDTV